MQTIYLISIGSILILLAAPAAAAIMSRARQVPSILSFAFFVVLQQLLFTFFAALIGSYLISFIFALLVVLAIGLKFCRGGSSLPGPTTARPTFLNYKSAPWIVFTLIFAAYCALRAHYSYINFNNNGDEAGVEKLFNLSLQQSFLFGQGFPPEWIWMAGEPIRYYIFLKSLPGLASWIARVIFGDPQTGGIFFILSEAFFAALSPAIICGWILLFGQAAKNQRAVCITAVAVALYSFLGTHYHAVSLGLSALIHGATLDWWQLSREVIPFTDNQYPVWFMILGDNHAYMQVYFLQILFWGSFLSVVVLDRISLLKSAALGVLAASLQLTHPGSVLIDISVCGVFIGAFALLNITGGSAGRLKACLSNGLVTIVTASFFLFFLYEPAGIVKFSVPPSELTSPLGAFLNLNFSVLLWMGLILVHPVIYRGISLVLNSHSRNFREWLLAVSFVLIISFYLLSRPALSLMVLLTSLTYLLLFDPRANDRQKTFSLFAVCSFSVWLLPEIVAFDHSIDSRTTWVRFQMSLRFWPEGYVLIPFAITAAVIERIGDFGLSRKWAGCAFGALAIFFCSHIPGVKNRIDRSRQAQTTLDGFKEFKQRYPEDMKIVAFLQDLPLEPKVVIAEACGIGDVRVPVDFGWSGRIAAFSGRSGVCGWARHAMLYNNPLRQLGFKAVSVEERSSTYLKYYLDLFSHLSAGDTAQAKIDILALKAYGVTHVIFGRYEKGLFPTYSLENIPTDLPLEAVFKSLNGMGVLKIDE